MWQSTFNKAVVVFLLLMELHLNFTFWLCCHKIKERTRKMSRSYVMYLFLDCFETFSGACLERVCP